MVVLNGCEVEFQPLYHQINDEESSQYHIDDGKYEDATSETEEEKLDKPEEEPREIDEDHASYDASTLGFITASAIAEEDRKLDSVIRNIIDECIKAAKKGETEARVVIDLGGTSNYTANKKARRISNILAERGFEVSCDSGTSAFECDRHVFNIKWPVAKPSHSVEHCY